MISSTSTLVEAGRDIAIRIEERTMHTSFDVILMDKYQVILGIKFMRRTHVMPILFFTLSV